MFKPVLESSQSFKSKHNIFFRYSLEHGPFVGFMLSSRFGNAVARNKFKNQARNLYAKFFNNSCYSIIVRPMKGDVNYQDLCGAFQELKEICVRNDK